MIPILSICNLVIPSEEYTNQININDALSQINARCHSLRASLMVSPQSPSSPTSVSFTAIAAGESEFDNFKNKAKNYFNTHTQNTNVSDNNNSETTIIPFHSSNKYKTTNNILILPSMPRFARRKIVVSEDDGILALTSISRKKNEVTTLKKIASDSSFSSFLQQQLPAIYTDYLEMLVAFEWKSTPPKSVPHCFLVRRHESFLDARRDLRLFPKGRRAGRFGIVALPHLDEDNEAHRRLSRRDEWVWNCNGDGALAIPSPVAQLVACSRITGSLAKLDVTNEEDGVAEGSSDYWKFWNIFSVDLSSSMSDLLKDKEDEKKNNKNNVDGITCSRGDSGSRNVKRTAVTSKREDAIPFALSFPLKSEVSKRISNNEEIISSKMSEKYKRAIVSVINDQHVLEVWAGPGSILRQEVQLDILMLSMENKGGIKKNRSLYRKGSFEASYNNNENNSFADSSFTIKSKLEGSSCENGKTMKDISTKAKKESVINAALVYKRAVTVTEFIDAIPLCVLRYLDNIITGHYALLHIRYIFKLYEKRRKQWEMADTCKFSLNKNRIILGETNKKGRYGEERDGSVDETSLNFATHKKAGQKVRIMVGGKKNNDNMPVMLYSPHRKIINHQNFDCFFLTGEIALEYLPEDPSDFFKELIKQYPQLKGKEEIEWTAKEGQEQRQSGAFFPAIDTNNNNDYNSKNKMQRLLIPKLVEDLMTKDEHRIIIFHGGVTYDAFYNEFPHTFSSSQFPSQVSPPPCTVSDIRLSKEPLPSHSFQQPLVMFPSETGSVLSSSILHQTIPFHYWHHIYHARAALRIFQQELRRLDQKFVGEYRKRQEAWLKKDQCIYIRNNEDAKRLGEGKQFQRILDLLLLNFTSLSSMSELKNNEKRKRGKNKSNSEELEKLSRILWDSGEGFLGEKEMQLLKESGNEDICGAFSLNSCESAFVQCQRQEACTDHGEKNSLVRLLATPLTPLLLVNDEVNAMKSWNDEEGAVVDGHTSTSLAERGKCFSGPPLSICKNDYIKVFKETANQYTYTQRPVSSPRHFCHTQEHNKGIPVNSDNNENTHNCVNDSVSFIPLKEDETGGFLYELLCQLLKEAQNSFAPRSFITQVAVSACIIGRYNNKSIIIADEEDNNANEGEKKTISRNVGRQKNSTLVNGSVDEILTPQDGTVVDLFAPLVIYGGCTLKLPPPVASHMDFGHENTSVREDAMAHFDHRGDVFVPLMGDSMRNPLIFTVGSRQDEWKSRRQTCEVKAGGRSGDSRQRDNQERGQKRQINAVPLLVPPSMCVLAPIGEEYDNDNELNRKLKITNSDINFYNYTNLLDFLAREGITLGMEEVKETGEGRIITSFSSASSSPNKKMKKDAEECLIRDGRHTPQRERERHSHLNTVVFAAFHLLEREDIRRFVQTIMTRWLAETEASRSDDSCSELQGKVNRPSYFFPLGNKQKVIRKPYREKSALKITLTVSKLCAGARLCDETFLAQDQHYVTGSGALFSFPPSSERVMRKKRFADISDFYLRRLAERSAAAAARAINGDDSCNGNEDGVSSSFLPDLTPKVSTLRIFSINRNSMAMQRTLHALGVAAQEESILYHRAYVRMVQEGASEHSIFHKEKEKGNVAGGSNGIKIGEIVLEKRSYSVPSSFDICQRQNEFSMSEEKHAKPSLFSPSQPRCNLDSNVSHVPIYGVGTYKGELCSTPLTYYQNYPSTLEVLIRDIEENDSNTKGLVNESHFVLALFKHLIPPYPHSSLLIPLFYGADCADVGADCGGLKRVWQNKIYHLMMLKCVQPFRCIMGELSVQRGALTSGSTVGMLYYKDFCCSAFSCEEGQENVASSTFPEALFSVDSSCTLAHIPHRFTAEARYIYEAAAARLVECADNLVTKRKIMQVIRFRETQRTLLALYTRKMQKEKTQPHDQAVAEQHQIGSLSNNNHWQQQAEIGADGLTGIQEKITDCQSLLSNKGSTNYFSIVDSAITKKTQREDRRMPPFLVGASAITDDGNLSFSPFPSSLSPSTANDNQMNMAVQGQLMRLSLLQPLSALPPVILIETTSLHDLPIEGLPLLASAKTGTIVMFDQGETIEQPEGRQGGTGIAELASNSQKTLAASAQGKNELKSSSILTPIEPFHDVERYQQQQGQDQGESSLAAPSTAAVRMYTSLRADDPYLVPTVLEDVTPDVTHAMNVFEKEIWNGLICNESLRRRVEKLGEDYMNTRRNVHFMKAKIKQFKKKTTRKGLGNEGVEGEGLRDENHQADSKTRKLLQEDRKSIVEAYAPDNKSRQSTFSLLTENVRESRREDRVNIEERKTDTTTNTTTSEPLIIQELLNEIKYFENTLQQLQRNLNENRNETAKEVSSLRATRNELSKNFVELSHDVTNLKERELKFVQTEFRVIVDQVKRESVRVLNEAQGLINNLCRRADKADALRSRVSTVALDDTLQGAGPSLSFLSSPLWVSSSYGSLKKYMNLYDTTTLLRMREKAIKHCIDAEEGRGSLLPFFPPVSLDQMVTVTPAAVASAAAATTVSTESMGSLGMTRMNSAFVSKVFKYQQELLPSHAAIIMPENELQGQFRRQNGREKHLMASRQGPQLNSFSTVLRQERGGPYRGGMDGSVQDDDVVLGYDGDSGRESSCRSSRSSKGLMNDNNETTCGGNIVHNTQRDLKTKKIIADTSKGVLSFLSELDEERLLLTESFKRYEDNQKSCQLQLSQVQSEQRQILRQLKALYGFCRAFRAVGQEFASVIMARTPRGTAMAKLCRRMAGESGRPAEGHPAFPFLEKWARGLLEAAFGAQKDGGKSKKLGAISRERRARTATDDQTEALLAQLKE